MTGNTAELDFFLLLLSFFSDLVIILRERFLGMICRCADAFSIRYRGALTFMSSVSARFRKVIRLLRVLLRLKADLLYFRVVFLGFKMAL